MIKQEKRNMVKQVIVMRTDLNLSKENMIIQSCHACLKVFLDRRKKGKRNLEIPLSMDMWEWVENDFYSKSCVGVTSEDELFDIEQEARTKKLPVAIIQDLELTEDEEPAYTCLAIGPADSDLIEKITNKLKAL